MLPLAAAGFHVIAPDQRGYGRTTGWDGDYDGDLGSFRMLNLVRDTLGLVSALGYRSRGSRGRARLRLAGRGLVRAGAAGRVPLGGADERAVRGPAGDAVRHGAMAPQPPRRARRRIHDELAALDPPRKHYQWYYSTREAERRHAALPAGRPRLPARLLPPQERGLEATTSRIRSTAWTASELAKLPTYYVMDLRQEDGETVAPEMPSAAEIAACTWLPEDELRGLQRGVRPDRLPGRPAMVSRAGPAADSTPSWRSSPVARSTCRPASSPARATGASTRSPASCETMQSEACTRMLGCHLVDGRRALGAAGAARGHHPLLLEFLRGAGA